MNARTFTLTATKVYAGTALRRLLFGPVGWLMYGFLLLPFGLKAWFENSLNPMGIGLCVLLSLLFVLHLFIRQKLESDDEALFSENNLAGFLSHAVVKHLGVQNPNAQMLLNAALRTDRGAFLLKEMGIDRSTIFKRCPAYAGPFDLAAWMEEGVKELAPRNEKKIDGSLILYLFFRHGGEFTTILNDCDLSMKDLEKILAWDGLHCKQTSVGSFLSPDFLTRSFGGVGRSWVMGYTHTLDRFTNDLSEGILWKCRRHVVLHKNELEAMHRIVKRGAQQNMLILGKPGTGRKMLVENFTYELRRMEMERGSAYTRVLVLQPELLLSGASQPDRVLVQALTQAQRAGKFILVVPNMGMLLQASNANVKNVLLQFLQSHGIALIGLSDPQDYHTLVKSDSALDSIFEKIFLEDASDDETMDVLMAQYFRLERRGIRMTYKALRSIVDLSKRYIGNTGFPGAAMKVMEDAILLAMQKGDRTVVEAHIREVISLKSHMDVRKAGKEERNQLLHLEEALQKKIVGQEKAIHGLVTALKRARLDVGVRKRPLGTFLFLGPTGVGKTETAKALAEVYFGSADSIVRVDMNEYSSPDSVYEIIGSPDPNHHADGFLTKKIQDQPFSLILLDEIEKAHPHVLNLFLQILDEGHLMDGRGMKTDFRNTIIIATSNAGALFIRDFFKTHPGIDASTSDFKEKLFDSILAQKLFSPEFLNRFDDVALYMPFTEKQIVELTILMLDSFIKDFEAKTGIIVSVDQAAVNALAKKGYSVEFGARQMRRTLTDIVETYLADVMLRKDLKRGDSVTMTKGDLGL